jgi:hypothetical protein
MTIKEFCEKYSGWATQSLKDDFVKDNLTIKPYLPFKEKLRLVESIVQPTVFKFEEYTTDTGEIKHRNSGQVKVDSISRQMLFYRSAIEKYTNLETSKDFGEDYDVLKQSGVLYELFSNSEDHKSLIPVEELVELNRMVDMKVDDTLTNTYEIHGYISGQVERFGKLANIAINPFLDKLADAIDNLDDEHLQKLDNIVGKATGIFKVVK